MWSVCVRKKGQCLPAICKKCFKISFFGKKWNLELSKPHHVITVITHHDLWSASVVTKLNIWKCDFFIQYSRFHISHFPSSQPTTAFSLKLGCTQFSLWKLQPLTPIHNDANNADNANDTDDANDADDYNRVTGIAPLKAISCAKNQLI